MGWILGIAVIMAALSIGILCYYQRQVKHICRQLAFLKEHESNMLIARSIEAGHIGELTDCLNELLSRQREERRSHQEKEQAISEIYTSLSHDIRTPLTSLDGYVQMLEKAENEEERRRYMEIISERIDSLKEMLEELFTYTKLKNETYQLELSTCLFDRIVRQTVISYHDEWCLRGVTPELMLTEEPLWIRGNAIALRRMLENLLKNALEHGKQNMRISLQKEEGEICLQVWNQIDENNRPDVTRVFERFYKADEVRRHASTGLGLSIAREFALRMNGTMEARLDGTAFGVITRFPVCEPPDAPYSEGDLPLHSAL